MQMKFMKKVLLIYTNKSKLISDYPSKLAVKHKRKNINLKGLFGKSIKFQ